MKANRFNFRFWDKKCQCMRNTYDDYHLNLKGEILSTEEYPSEDCYVIVKYESTKDRLVLMQSTGLTDRNGKEIFERDILKMYTAYNDEDEIDTNEFYITDVGKYGEVRVFYKDYDSTLLDWLDDEEVYEYEIIGNIYENPELLKN